MTVLIATYNFHYGRMGPHDKEPPLLTIGDEFEPIANGQASASEEARFLIARGQAMTPETWANCGGKMLIRAQWAKDFLASAGRRGIGA